MAEHRNLNEKLFELVVKKAVIDKTDAECEAIYEKYKDSAEPHYSESHQQRMEKLIRSSIKKEKRYGHWVRNVVAVFIAVVAIGHLCSPWKQCVLKSLTGLHHSPEGILI